MELLLPESIGTVVDARLNAQGPNIVMAADRHVSWYSKLNITRTYYHLASNHGLSTVSFEGNPEPLHFMGHNCEKGRNLQPFLKALAEADDSSEFLHDSDGLMVDYESMIGDAAHFMGVSIDVVPAFKNRAALELDNACMRFINLENLVSDELVPKEEVERYFETYYHHVLDAAEVVGDRIEATFPESEEQFEPNDFSKTVKMFKDMAWYFRTEDQLGLLQQYMSDNDRMIGLLCLGANHREDFTKLTEKKGIGSAVVLPRGLEIGDPRVEREWMSEIEGIFNGD